MKPIHTFLLHSALVEHYLNGDRALKQEVQKHGKLIALSLIPRYVPECCKALSERSCRNEDGSMTFDYFLVCSNEN